MAIFGSFHEVRARLADDILFSGAFEYVAELLDPGSVANKRIGLMSAGATGRIELADGAFAIEQVYQPKARPEGFFESHRKYIDVQVIVEGEELMEVEEISRLGVTDAYDPERDLIKYGDTTMASLLRMRAGDVAIFHPSDGHMPALHWRGSGLVRKTVVKVPV